MGYSIEAVNRDKNKKDHYNDMTLQQLERKHNLEIIQNAIITEQNQINTYQNDNINNNIPDLDPFPHEYLNQNNNLSNSNINISPNIHRNSSHNNHNHFEQKSERKCRDLQHQLCDLCNCNQIQTVEHFVCKCNAFDAERKILQNKLQRIDNRLRNKWFDINILLFPYKIKELKKDIHKQLLIWKYLTQFIIQSKLIRFNYSNYMELNPNRWDEIINYEKNKSVKLQKLKNLKSERLKLQKAQNKHYYHNYYH